MRKLTSAVASAVMAFAGMAGMMSTPAQAATGLEYVALGDSYASGVGADYYDGASGDCKRSTVDYPALWAAAHGDYTLKDVSCSGAKIADVRDKQLSALSADTDLVTLTVGGNDAQFSTVAQGCLTQGDSWCDSATLYMSSYAKGQLVTSLAGLYKDIKAKAPNARVVVLGYPQTVSPTGTCPLIDLSSAKRTAMNQLADALAEGTKAAAAKEPVQFIDMRDSFKGHGACGSDPWINDLNAGTAVFHPTLMGYLAGYDARLNEVTG
ncbi:SGNH/GDSL hydrolase family protein [Streptomyces sp. NBC_00582]|uniref:SGNH/GDSL hydrolase family protein n=1 Tax=Streptomyces sp. NBC_00582 TaxID=2975783 RepID=UPI001063EAC2|nr:SGNH/GDSL hydrolase family protein [Streptomyces sp. NBC_00582]WUB63114.1 SGNH/GDSL hydrolase family protein [Streptomyces sp. NBC_00582]